MRRGGVAGRRRGGRRRGCGRGVGAAVGDLRDELVLQLVDVSDGLQDDVQLGHGLLPADGGDQGLEAAELHLRLLAQAPGFAAAGLGDAGGGGGGQLVLDAPQGVGGGGGRVAAAAPVGGGGGGGGALDDHGEVAKGV